MCIKVSLLGRLGNNLFQYALGRIIAEHHDLELESTQIMPPSRSVMGHHLDSGPAATLESLATYFPNAPLHMDGRHFDEPIERFEMSRDHKWRGQTIDLDSILSNNAPRQIRLRGYFQRVEYFAPYLDQLREWFRLKSVSIPFSPDAKDVVVSIRRGQDYGINNWTLPASYYDRVLAGIAELGTVHVCGVGIDDVIREKLQKYAPRYYEGTPIEHFAFISRFNRIVLSNSTFAWWAAYLSHAADIYAPSTTDGSFYSFTGFEDVDLHMRQSRYHEVEQNVPASFTIFVVNKSLPAYFRENKQELIVGRADGNLTFIEVDDANRDSLSWLLRQDQPIALADITKDHWMGQRTLEQLIACGFLCVQPQLTD